MPPYFLWKRNWWWECHKRQGWKLWTHHTPYEPGGFNVCGDGALHVPIWITQHAVWGCLWVSTTSRSLPDSMVICGFVTGGGPGLVATHPTKDTLGSGIRANGFTHIGPCTNCLLDPYRIATTYTSICHNEAAARGECDGGKDCRHHACCFNPTIWYPSNVKAISTTVPSPNRFKKITELDSL